MNTLNYNWREELLEEHSAETKKKRHRFLIVDVLIQNIKLKALADSKSQILLI